MNKPKWRWKALILLWLCGMASCHEKAEIPSVTTPVLSRSGIMMPIKSNHVTELSSEEEATVFVCKSAGAKRYHYNQNCRGLKRCKKEIEELDQASAENVGLTLCKYEN